MKKFNASHHRPFDAITPAEEGEPMTPDRFTYAHPAERIAQSVTGVIRLARHIADNATLPEVVRSDADKIILALFDVPSDAAAMQLAIERRDEDMRGVLESNYRMAQEITELRQKLPVLHAESPAIDVPVTREPRSAAAGE